MTDGWHFLNPLQIVYCGGKFTTNQRICNTTVLRGIMDGASWFFIHIYGYWVRTCLYCAAGYIADDGSRPECPG